MHPKANQALTVHDVAAHLNVDEKKRFIASRSAESCRDLGSLARGASSQSPHKPSAKSDPCFKARFSKASSV